MSHRFSALEFKNGINFTAAQKGENGIPTLDVFNMYTKGIRVDLSNLYRVDLKPKEDYILKNGDLLFVRSSVKRDGVGWTSLVRGQSDPVTFCGFIIRGRLREAGVSPEYLTYFLRSQRAREAIISSASQVTITNINQVALGKIEVPLAPVEEQPRIVAEIEKQFTRLDAGVASVKRVQIALKRYRASVLKAACEGHLTGDNTLVALTPLRDVITGLGQGWSPKCELNREPLPSEWAIIKTTAVQSMKYLDSESKPLPETLSPRPAIEIKAGDFLMTGKGPRQRAGVTCLVRSTRHLLMVCDTVYRFRCQESRVNPAYLELALNSPHTVSEIDRRKSGINDSGVSLTHKKLDTVMLSIPSLPEQKRIVSEVERRFSVIDELVTAINANLKRAERLRQSILHSAFTGKL